MLQYKFLAVNFSMSSAPTKLNEEWVALSHQLTLPRLAWPMVILLELCSLQRRQPRSHMAWMLPSILTSFSWFSWNAASGTPNCFLSPRYLIKCSTVRAAQQEWVHQNIVNRSLLVEVLYLWHASYTPTAMPMLTHAAMTRLKARDCAQGQQRCLVPYLLWTTKLFLTYVWVCMYVEDISITFTRSWKELAQIISRDEHILQLDVAVLDNSHWNLVLDLAGLQTRASSIHNEPDIMVRHKKKIYIQSLCEQDQCIHNLPYPLTWLVLVFRAKTTNTSAKLLFPGHRFLPFRTHPPGTY